jgi:hypothetical protein
MLKYRIYLSESYTEVYVITNSVFCVEPLSVHLTSSASKGFVNHYRLIEKIKKLN